MEHKEEILKEILILGYSTGSHLHFEIRSTQSGSAIDPAGYIFPVPEPEETTESEAVTSE